MALAALAPHALALGTTESSVRSRAVAEVTCAACLVEDDHGNVLWARAATTRRANASTTKMATALIVARRTRPDEVVTVSPEAASTGGGGLDLHAGERFSVRDLLYALLLTSSNDAAVALAEHVSGTEKAFVARMNALAAATGARDTHFVNAHGLDHPGHFSTARDLALFADRLLAVPSLAAIVGTAQATIDGPAGGLLIENRNPLLESYRGAIGVKTGFTDDAGDVLVAAARRAGRRLIAVAMGSTNAAADARRLLDYGFRTLRRTLLLQRGAPVGSLVFDPAGSAAVRAANSVRGMTDPTAIRRTFDAESHVGLPLAAGDVVGVVELWTKRHAVARVPAVVAEPPPEPAQSQRDLLEYLGVALRWGDVLLPGAPGR